MSKVQDIKKSSLTFAPEAGSQRMRNVINKGLTEEVILDGAGKAFEGGWNKVKLYFMLGLPTETEDDIKGIAHLAEKIAERYYEIPKDQRNGKCQITASSSFFIPKPFTPFQWAPMNTEREFLDKAAIVKAEVRAQLNQKSIRYIYHEADISLLEGFLARGDRKCAEVIEKRTEKVLFSMPGPSISGKMPGKKRLQRPALTFRSMPAVSAAPMRSFRGISLISA